MTPIWDIPFPSVTICPQVKAVKDNFNFSNAIHKLQKKNITNLSKTEKTYLNAMLQVCNPENLKNQHYITEDNFNILKILEKLAPTLNNSAPFCKWKNKILFCTEIFNKVITNDGICFQFNGISKTELLVNEMINESEASLKSMWSIDIGYKDNTNSTVYPERAFGAGARSGLFLALQGFDYDIDYLCHGTVHGFKVYLDSPDELPTTSQQYFQIPFDQEFLIFVKPKKFTTSEYLRNLSPEQRQCFFSEERQLKFFHVYTQKNCYFECLTNFTLQKCGCVKFSMPSSNGMRICRSSEIQCTIDAIEELLWKEFHQINIKTAQNFENIESCNCLPGCTSISYDFEISQADFNVIELLKAFGDSYIEDNPGFKMSRLSIFFKEQQFITTKRVELYGLSTFFANSGGLLGLFMGISILSFVEIFYFFTLRFISILIRHLEIKERIYKDNNK